MRYHGLWLHGWNARFTSSTIISRHADISLMKLSNSSRPSELWVSVFGQARVYVNKFSTTLHDPVGNLLSSFATHQLLSARLTISERDITILKLLFSTCEPRFRLTWCRNSGSHPSTHLLRMGNSWLCYSTFSPGATPHPTTVYTIIFYVTPTE